jgi:hypothetical protein
MKLEKVCVLEGHDRDGRNNERVTLGVFGEQKLSVCGTHCLIDFSESFAASSIGVQQARSVVQREVQGRIMSVFTTLAIEVELRKMISHSNIFSKQLTLRYRYIIVNVSQYALSIHEEGSHLHCFDVQPGAHKPFFSTLPPQQTQTRKMIIRALHTCQSQPIITTTLGMVYFRLKLLDSIDSYIYFCINIREKGVCIFYEFREVAYDELPYLLTVKSERFQVEAPQVQCMSLRKTSPAFHFLN